MPEDIRFRRWRAKPHRFHPYKGASEKRKLQCSLCDYRIDHWLHKQPKLVGQPEKGRRILTPQKKSAKKGRKAR